MFKHIGVQSIYQLLVLLLVVFVGEHWIPESNPYISTPDGFIIPGRAVAGYDEDEDGPSRMYTFVFNVFVFMTIGDFINARKLHEELNVFAGISKATYFVVIMMLIVIFQAIIVSVGNVAFRCKWGVPFSFLLEMLGRGWSTTNGSCASAS
jgi:P-type Ca2+ transporter type 2B